VNWNRGFTGYIADGETGLLHARARQFSPELGRFIGRDPVRKNGDLLRGGNPELTFRLHETGMLSPSAQRRRLEKVSHDGTWLFRLKDDEYQIFEIVPQKPAPLPKDGYLDSMSLYAASFIPNALDFSGEATCCQGTTRAGGFSFNTYNLWEGGCCPGALVPVSLYWCGAVGIDPAARGWQFGPTGGGYNGSGGRWNASAGAGLGPTGEPSAVGQLRFNL